MNSLDNTDQSETENPPSDAAKIETELDDEFENEELGERQPETCSIDDDCLSCQ